jgi:hypothetical protein
MRPATVQAVWQVRKNCVLVVDVLAGAGVDDDGIADERLRQVQVGNRRPWRAVQVYGIHRVWPEKGAVEHFGLDERQRLLWRAGLAETGQKWSDVGPAHKLPHVGDETVGMQVAVPVGLP